MKQWSLGPVLVSLCMIAASATPSAAGLLDEDPELTAWQYSETHPGKVTLENSKWQFGVAVGYAFVQNAPIIHQTTTNVFSEFLSDSDVVAEISGKLHNSIDVGVNLYRRLGRFWSVGLESDYQVSHKVDAVMTNTPAFSSFLELAGFTTSVTSHEAITEVIPCMRLSTQWNGRSRLYAVAGAGWAAVRLSNTIHYTFNASDGTTTDIPFDQISQHSYAAAKAGVGMDYSLWEGGAMGIDLRYNMIFNPGDDLRMFIPTVHFDYNF